MTLEEFRQLLAAACSEFSRDDILNEYAQLRWKLEHAPPVEAITAVLWELPDSRIQALAAALPEAMAAHRQRADQHPEIPY